MIIGEESDDGDSFELIIKFATLKWTEFDFGFGKNSPLSKQPFNDGTEINIWLILENNICDNFNSLLSEFL